MRCGSPEHPLADAPDRGGSVPEFSEWAAVAGIDGFAQCGKLAEREGRQTFEVVGRVVGIIVAACGAGCGFGGGGCLMGDVSDFFRVPRGFDRTGGASGQHRGQRIRDVFVELRCIKLGLMLRNRASIRRIAAILLGGLAAGLDGMPDRSKGCRRRFRREDGFLSCFGDRFACGLIRNNKIHTEERLASTKALDGFQAAFDHLQLRIVQLAARVQQRLNSPGMSHSEGHDGAER
jgi:hypothetical protein